MLAAQKLELTLEGDRTAWEPAARVNGVATWSSPIAPRGMELRLSWSLQGRGGRDLKIADTIPFLNPTAAERRTFVLTLPAGPYSLKGRLVALTWALELVALPGEEKARVDLVIAPGGRTVSLA
jgi:hypothetical protein